MTRGSTRVSSTVSAAKLRNSPLPVTCEKNAGPPPPPPRGDPASRSATPMITGTAKTTANSARLRRRLKTSASSERAYLSHARPAAGARPTGAVPPVGTVPAVPAVPAGARQHVSR